VTRLPRMKRPSLVVLLLLLASSALQAEIKNFRFTGKISYVDNPNLYLDGIQSNTPFEGFYIFDTATTDSNGDGTVGDFRHTSSAYGIVVKVGKYIFRTNPRKVNFLVELVNRPNSDNYLLRSYYNVCSEPLAVDHISWQLDDSTGTALSNALLPATPPVLTNFQSTFGLSISGFGFMFRGHVETIVESPAIIPETPSTTLNLALELSWPSVMGYFYQMQSSPNLIDWTDVGEPVLGDGTVLSKFFKNDPNQKLFYRAVIKNFPD
jgi:hypothetical protein